MSRYSRENSSDNQRANGKREKTSDHLNEGRLSDKDPEVSDILEKFDRLVELGDSLKVDPAAERIKAEKEGNRLVEIDLP